MDVVVVPDGAAAVKSDFGARKPKPRFQVGLNKDFANLFLSGESLNQAPGAVGVEGKPAPASLRGEVTQDAVLPIALFFTVFGGVFFPCQWNFAHPVTRKGGNGLGYLPGLGVVVLKRKVELFAVVVAQVGQQGKPVEKGKIGVEVIYSCSGIGGAHVFGHPKGYFLQLRLYIVPVEDTGPYIAGLQAPFLKDRQRYPPQWFCNQGNEKKSDYKVAPGEQQRFGRHPFPCGFDLPVDKPKKEKAQKPNHATHLGKNRKQPGE